MGFGSCDRGLSQPPCPRGDRAAYARPEMGEGGARALRAREIVRRQSRLALLRFNYDHPGLFMRRRSGGRVAVVPLSSYPAARPRYLLGWFAGRLFCAGFDDVNLDLGDAFSGDA